MPPTSPRSTCRWASSACAFAATAGGRGARKAKPRIGPRAKPPRRPGDPPFVEVGDAVAEDSVIGIIEVMKLMNPIRAGVRGTVTAILAADGTAVEEGQPLLRVRVG